MILEKIKNLESIVDGENTTIVINGRLFSYKNNLVRTKVINGNLVFYIRKNNGFEQNKRHIIANGSELLIAMLNDSEAFGFPKSLQPVEVVDGSVNYDKDLRYVFINSKLYDMLCSFIKKYDYSEYRFRYESVEGDVIVDNFKDIYTRFMSNAYSSYLDIVLSKKVLGYIKRSRRLSFYNTLDAFIPLFINISGVFNPMIDVKNSRIKSSRIYKHLVDNNREVSVNNTMKVMFISQKEVCEKLGMRYFYRFSTKTLYYLLVGFLEPTNINYPNKNNIVFAAPENLVIDDPAMRRIYSRVGYNALMKKLASIEEKDTRVLNLTRTLHKFEEKSTLELYLSKQKKIGNMGVALLDKDYNDNDILAYLKDAEL